MCFDGVDSWAGRQFGAADLGDVRRTKRLVKVAASMASNPAGTMPQQFLEWADLKAAYRLFDSPEVTFEAIAKPHYEQRHNCGAGRFLIVSDTTELNFTPQRNIPNLGRLGKGQGYGFLLHSALMLKDDGILLGLAQQELTCRKPKSKKKRTRTQALKQPRESELWNHVIDAVGSPPAGAQWIHVADRGADNFEVFHHCMQQQCDWVVRARCLSRNVLFANNTQAETPTFSQEKQSLQSGLNTLRVVDEYSLKVRERRKNSRTAGRSAHVARLQVSVGTCQMPLPRLRSPNMKGEDVVPITMQIVLVQEWDPPAGDDPIRWILYTSLPVETVEQVRDIIRFYQYRWTIEEWHKALKTGCRVTSRQLQTRDRLEPLIALLSVQAVRLLSLKQLARQDPDRDARELVPQVYLQVLNKFRRRKQSGWTLKEFLHTVAGLGGFLRRKHDGEPGWQTIWLGWQTLNTLVKGFYLAKEPP